MRVYACLCVLMRVYACLCVFISIACFMRVYQYCVFYACLSVLRVLCVFISIACFMRVYQYCVFYACLSVLRESRKWQDGTEDIFRTYGFYIMSTWGHWSKAANGCFLRNIYIYIYTYLLLFSHTSDDAFNSSVTHSFSKPRSCYREMQEIQLSWFDFGGFGSTE